MAAAAVSSSLTSTGYLNAVHAVSGKSVAVSRGGSGSQQVLWDPLQRRHAGLRSSSSRSSDLSAASVLAPSAFAFAFGGKLAEKSPSSSSRLRWTVPRAASREGDEEAECVSEIDSEESSVVQSAETPKGGWSQLLSSAAKPAVVAVMMALLLAQPVEDSLAASSGGRMGGKVFSKPSAPSRSYSGGGGGGGGRAYSGGGYAAPPLYGSPYGYSPFGYSPFYGGGYGGGGLFLGPSIGFGGGGTIILAMIAFATVRAVVGFIRDRFSGDEDDRFDE